MTEYVLVLTTSNAGAFTRPKYWTGKMLEHWPEYVSQIERAHRFPDKRSAVEVLSGFRARGFDGKVVTA